MLDKPRVLVLDNYDSFTYNLVQLLADLGAAPEVRLNDRVTLEQVAEMAPDQILISPGPGAPDQAGLSLSLIDRFAGRIPILGVCLGHQAVASVFGGTIVRAPVVVHGKASPIRHDGRTIFTGLPDPFSAMRYHSLVVARGSVPSCLEVSAWTADGLVMGIRHRTLAVEGVQFHPESCLTPAGRGLLANFLALAAR